MPLHVIMPTNYAAKVVTVAADILLLQDSEDTNNPKQTTVAGLVGIPAANIVSTPAGNLAAADLQAAVNELQGDIDNLNTVNAANYFAGAIDPIAANGSDGDFFINVASGDVFGPKAAGAWAASIGNAYAQLGLSATAGAASQVAGGAGVAATAARGDHFHPRQTAAEVAVAGGITGLVATDVQAALAELQAEILGAASTLQDVTDVGNVTTNDIEFTDPTKGPVIRSTGGVRWRLAIEDNGVMNPVAA